MTDDLPPDVQTVLSQLFSEGEEALEEDDVETCIQTVESAESVATNKLPDGEVRDRILHGCERVRALVNEEEPDAAMEFLAAMARVVDEQ